MERQKMIRRVLLDIINRKKVFLFKLIVISASFLVIISAFHLNIISQHYLNEVNHKRIQLMISSTCNINNRLELIYKNNQDIYLSDLEKLDHIISNIDEEGVYKALIKDDYSFSSFIVSNGQLSGMYRITSQSDTLDDETFYLNNEISFNAGQRHENNTLTYENDYNNSYFESTDQCQMYDLVCRRVEIIDGRTFTNQEIDAGEKVCIIPENMVLLVKYGDTVIRKKISVGDTVLFTNRIDGIYGECHYYVEDKLSEYLSTGFKVIGIYRNSKQYNYGKVYIPDKTLSDLWHTMMPIYSANSTYRIINNNKAVLLYKPIVLICDSVEQLRKLNESIAKENDPSITTYADIGEIKQTASLIISLSSGFKTVTGVMSLLAFIAVISMLFIDLHKRQTETGLLMKCGLKTGQLLRQYSIENMLISVLAICILPVLLCFVKDMEIIPGIMLLTDDRVIRNFNSQFIIICFVYAALIGSVTCMFTLHQVRNNSVKTLLGE